MCMWPPLLVSEILSSKHWTMMHFHLVSIFMVLDMEGFMTLDSGKMTQVAGISHHGALWVLGARVVRNVTGWGLPFQGLVITMIMLGDGQSVTVTRCDGDLVTLYGEPSSCTPSTPSPSPCSAGGPERHHQKRGHLEGHQRHGEEEAGGLQGTQLLGPDVQDSVQKGFLPAVVLDRPHIPEDAAGEPRPTVLLPHLLFLGPERRREERTGSLECSFSATTTSSHPYPAPPSSPAPARVLRPAGLPPTSGLLPTAKPDGGSSSW